MFMLLLAVHTGGIFIAVITVSLLLLFAQHVLFSNLTVFYKMYVNRIIQKSEE